MTLREFLRTVTNDEFLDKPILFNVYIDENEVVMEFDGIDEVDEFTAVNLRIKDVRNG